MPTWGNGPIIPHAPTGRYGKIGPCGNSVQFGSPGGRFRKAETELKLHGGFKPFSIAFARVNKQEYKYVGIGFRSICNLECRQIAPRKLSIFACIVAILATMQA